MLALGLVLNTVGIGLFCWLIFTLAVYALPFFVAVNAGMIAFHSGAGILGAPLVGIAAGAMTLAIGQTAFAMTRPLILRVVIAAAFAVPAAVAGYHVVLVMSQIGMPSPAWREVFACLGALFIGGTAWTRLIVFAELHPLQTSAVVQSAPHVVLSAATRDG
jgi:intracellular septation protein A